MKSKDAKALATKQRAAARTNKKEPVNANTLKGRMALQEKERKKSIKDQVTYNRPNQTNPFGSKKWVQNPDGSFTEDTQLTPEQQELLNQQTKRDLGFGNIAQGQLAGLQQAANRPFDLSGIGNDPTKFNYGEARSAAEKRVYDRFATRNEPRFEKEQKDFEQSMAAQGVPAGSDKYNELKTSLLRGQQDQRDSAGTEAFKLGGSEEAQAFGQGLQSRQQGVSEYGQTRDAPYQDLANTLSLQKGVMLPNFQNPNQVDVGGVDAAGIAAQLAQEQLGKSQLKLRGSGGGGGAAEPPFSLATDPAMQKWLAQQEYLKANQPKGPSTAQQVLATVGPGLGQGFGNMLGDKFGKINWGSIF